MVEFFKHKMNIPFLMILIIGIVAGTFKYGFLATTLSIAIIAVFGIVAGLIIRIIKKQKIN